MESLIQLHWFHIYHCISLRSVVERVVLPVVSDSEPTLCILFTNWLIMIHCIDWWLRYRTGRHPINPWGAGLEPLQSFVSPEQCVWRTVTHFGGCNTVGNGVKHQLSLYPVDSDSRTGLGWVRQTVLLTSWCTACYVCVLVWCQKPVGRWVASLLSPSLLAGFRKSLL